jgi:DUF1680 family protein
MRFLATLPDIAVTADSSGLQVHQYVPGTFSAEVDGGSIEIAVRTRYPWDGNVEVLITQTIERPWSVSLRVPAWCSAAVARVGGETYFGDDAGRIRLHRKWSVGDVILLELEMAPRFVEPDPRIDAVRSCLAIERGPLVYAVEDADLAGGASIESLEVEGTSELRVEAASEDGLGEMVRLSFDALLRSDPARHWPYGDHGQVPVPGRETTRVRAMPYFAWGNRRGLGMRIWLPWRP